MMQSLSHHQRNTDNTGGIKKCNSENIKKQEINLFTVIDNLAVGHDVTVSNTMIKVTYNKGLKDNSITSCIGKDIKNQQHSAAFRSSYSYDFSNKVSQGNETDGKSLNDLALITDNAGVKSNITNRIESIKNTVSQKCPRAINEEKQYDSHNKMSLSKNECDVKSCTFNNHFPRFEQYNLKDLKVSLLKMNKLKCDSDNSASVNKVKDVCHNQIKNKINEADEKQFFKTSSSKNVHEIKNFSSSESAMKKERVESTVSNSVARERLKLIKNKDENFKKKKSTTDQTINQHKKAKIELSKLSKHLNEEIILGKGKTDVKKSSPKSLNNSIEMCKDSFKKELLRDDPSLPPGWRRLIKGKHVGSELKPVVCIASPEGRKFYFKAKLKEYLERTNSQLTIDDFYFGLYERNDNGRITVKEGNKKEETDSSKKFPRKRKKKIEESISIEDESKKFRLNDKNSFTKTNDNSSSFNSDSSVVQDQNLFLGKESSEIDTIDKKNVLLSDPDLPSGWVRNVRIVEDAEGVDKFQVCLISPEGRKFSRRYVLRNYLIKTKSSLDINQFYFGLYPRKNGGNASFTVESKSDVMKIQGKMRNSTGSMKKVKKNEQSGEFMNKSGNTNDSENSQIFGQKEISLILKRVDDDVNIDEDQPMLNDPNLPPGWRRYIKVRSTGESAGRMEVIIVSPDGRRHRSKGSLEQYIKQQELPFKIDDFDFCVFGKNSKRYSSSSTPTKVKLDGSVRKRSSMLSPSSTTFPNININHHSIFNEANKSRESLMINYVGGLMVNCGLRDLRSERRLRNHKDEQEKCLKEFLDSQNNENSNNENEIPITWVQRIIHCRSDLGTLDMDAAETIATLTKDFLQRLTKQALEVSESEDGLQYGDLAELVDKSKSLSPLKTLIPKKITFREYVRLNRPKKFTSFT